MNTSQCSQIVDRIYPLHFTSLLQKEPFFKYNLGKFLKYITFSSCSLIIFENLSKWYLKICFFSIKCQNGGGKFHPRSGSTDTSNINVITKIIKQKLHYWVLKYKNIANTMLHSCKLSIDYYTKYRSDLCE